MNAVEMLIVGGALEVQEKISAMKDYLPEEDTIESRLEAERMEAMMETTDRVITLGGLGPEDFETNPPAAQKETEPLSKYISTWPFVR